MVLYNPTPPQWCSLVTSNRSIESKNSSFVFVSIHLKIVLALDTRCLRPHCWFGRCTVELDWDTWHTSYLLFWNLYVENATSEWLPVTYTEQVRTFVPATVRGKRNKQVASGKQIASSRVCNSVAFRSWPNSPGTVEGGNAAYPLRKQQKQSRFLKRLWLLDQFCGVFARWSY